MQATTFRLGAFVITPSDAANLPDTAVGVLVGGTAGNIRVLTDAGDDITIAVTSFQTLPIQVAKVFATGTTATPLYGLR